MLYFLKLGGSLITDKTRAHSPRLDVIQRLASEIVSAKAAQPDLRLLVGHGSGSFGHMPASKHHTRQGVHTPQEWQGFVEVWNEARALNQILVEAFQTAGLPILAFPPSASVIASNGLVNQWDLTPILSALNAGLTPLINGDTVFDTLRGGTILSTEDLFSYLTARLRPSRILLAGIDAGVWSDFPTCTRLIDAITPQTYPDLRSKLAGSAAVDVTGGMEEKVSLLLQMAQLHPGLQASIFSGVEPGNVYNALNGNLIGTLIKGTNE